MRIHIGQKVSEPVIKNKFEITTSHYSGDADVYHTNTVLRDISQEDAINEAYSIQDHACDSELVCDLIDTWPEDVQKCYQDEVIPWPHDVFSDGEMAATLDTISIFFYDANGEKYKCAMVGGNINGE